MNRPEPSPINYDSDQPASNQAPEPEPEPELEPLRIRFKNWPYKGLEATYDGEDGTWEFEDESMRELLDAKTDRLRSQMPYAADPEQALVLRVAGDGMIDAELVNPRPPPPYDPNKIY